MKHVLFPLRLISLAFVSCLLLIACGGSDSADDDSDNPGGGEGSATSFTVTTQSSEGGQISPERREVEEGERTTFSVEPLTGYQVAGVTGCGGELNGATYTTGAVSAACEVSASFEPRTYTVSGTIDELGGELVEPSIAVASGEMASFTVDLFPHYTFDRLDSGECHYESIKYINDFSGSIPVIVGLEFDIGPVTADCDFTVELIPPPDDLELTVAVNMFGAAVESDSVTAGFGEAVTIPVTSLLDRSLVNWESSCKSGEWQGTSFHISRLSDHCELNAVFNSDNEVYIASPVVAAHVIDALGFDPETELLTPERMGDLTSLTISQKDVRDLTGLEAASNLTDLNLEYNFNLTGEALVSLQGLPLQTLNLAYSSVEELSPLAGLPLKTLDLSFSSINDLTGLTDIPTIETLAISGGDYSDLEGLVELDQLSHLTMLASKALDIRPLLQTGLNIPGVGSQLQADGCMSLQQPASQFVRDTLNANAVYVAINSTPTRRDCDFKLDIEATADAEANGGQVDVVVDLPAGAPGVELTCELHYGLTQQMPRVPLVTENACHDGSVLSFSPELAEYDLTMVIRDELGRQEILSAGSYEHAAGTVARVDWGQATVKTNPELVPARSALLRAHILEQGQSTKPVVKFRLALNGDSTDVLATAPGSLPDSVVHDSLGSSYHAVIESDWMEPGLTVDVLVDDTSAYQVDPVFATQHTLYLSVFAFEINGVRATIPGDEVLRDAALAHWPLADVEIVREDPIVMDPRADKYSVNELLYHLSDMHELDGAQQHYHAFFPASEVEAGLLGLANTPGYAGVTYDDTDMADVTFAHEIGHNFSVSHIDCNVFDSVELNFPYPPRTLGSVGINLALDELKKPENFSDVMGYCNPRGVSDWVYEKAQDYLEVEPPKAPGATSGELLAQNYVYSQSNVPYSTFISGVVNVTSNEAKLLRVVPQNVSSNRSGGSNSGQFELHATDRYGEVYKQHFAVATTSHSTSPLQGHFQVRVPMSDVATIRIFYRGRLLLEKDAAEVPDH